MKRTITTCFLILLLLVATTRPAQAGLSNEFAVVGAIPSLSFDGTKEAATQMIADAGFGWMRHEFIQRESMDFRAYDQANTYAKARGIKTLALLQYQPTSDQYHEQWRQFVTTVATRYGTDIAAWEIMNEQDNFISPETYVPYLKEAYQIIKSINPNAVVVLGGLTSRSEAFSFWDGVKQANGWSYFDALGLHPYHSEGPEKTNYSGGDFVTELSKVVSNINKNGGGKKIWITETGYNIKEVGEDNQAKWLTRTLVMARTIPEVEKIFVYRLYDSSDSPFGLTSISLTEHPSFEAVQTLISILSGKGIGKRIALSQKNLYAYQFGDTVTFWSSRGVTEAILCGDNRQFTESVTYLVGASCDNSAPQTSTSQATGKTVQTITTSRSPQAPSSTVDKAASIVRIDGSSKRANGTDTYRIVITLKDNKGNGIKDQKPQIIAANNTTGVIIHETHLVGDEWWTEVGSKETGDKQLAIRASSQELKTITISFLSLATPSSPSTLVSPALRQVTYVAGTQEKKMRIILISINLLLLSLICVIILLRISRIRNFLTAKLRQITRRQNII